MFDFFLHEDFTRSGGATGIKATFSGLPFYSDIRKVEYRSDLSSGYAVYLERSETRENHFENGTEHLFVFGSVFTNNEYSSRHATSPERLYARELYGLYKTHGQGVTRFIKGSFVLVIIDDSVPDCILISDRLNVLPLYYSIDSRRLLVSSSLRLLLRAGQIEKNVDRVALAEQLVFDFILGERTIVKGVRRVNPGSVYRFGPGGAEVNSYWDVGSLYNETLLKRGESLDLLAEQLFANVQLYTSDTRKLLVSLTGGFDGRTNLAMLRKPKRDYLCYSYGMPGSRQISVPEDISRNLDVPYKPVLCNGEFEGSYVESAAKVVEFSNATAPYTQAVMPYAYSKLSQYSDVILTGLFGSEVLRPLHNLGIIINDWSQRIFLSDDPRSEINLILRELASLGYVDAGLLNGTLGEAVEEIYDLAVKPFEPFDKITRFFMFTLREGIRKYFSQEIQSERVYVTNRFPYFDDDFVELIYKTTYAGMYNGFLGKSKFKRRKGQLLYARIMKKYFRELLAVRLDRGYKPADLISPFPFNYLAIGAAVYKTKKYYSAVGNDTFDTPKWAVSYLSESRKKFVPDPVFKKGLIEFDELDDERKRLKVAHLLSIYNYLRDE